MEKQESKKLTGKEAVKFENYMHTGNLDVSRELHDEIKPTIPEENFVVKLWQYDNFVNYTYANDANDLNWEHNWSQERTIEGFETIEDISEALEEVSFR